MKRIIFIENRLQTYTWEWMVNHLDNNGHKVHWIVENHHFIPKKGVVHIIPYPHNSDIEVNNDIMPEGLREYISDTDRNFNYFGHKDTSHYSYYYGKIKEIIDSVKPDFVFGECTEFHELIASLYCKSVGIIYLNLSSCRYPVDRFAFYQYNTFEPYKGSNESYSYSDALALANEIANRSTQPFYMAPHKFSISDYMINLKYKVVNTICYFAGEKYCTPSPFRKYLLEKRLKRLVKMWVKSANEDWRSKIAGRFVVMYPMQMQPESNIDVTGHPYQNQTNTIKTISELLYDDELLIVKPNPHAKYELTEEMMEVIHSSPNIVIVPFSTAMGEVLPCSDLVLTITGTIAIECILSNKPVVTMIKTINNNQDNCKYLKDFSQLRSQIDAVKSNRFPQISDEKKVEFVNKLVSTSYKGYPYGLKVDNNVLDALDKILDES